MKRLFPIAFVSLLIMIACKKKEPTTWEPNWKAPLVTGRLSLENSLPDYTSQNTDGYASLKYNDTVFSFRIDTLIKLPDTSLVQKTAISFSSLTLSPGNSINNNNLDQLYDLGEISLKRVIIQEGLAFITISSPWPGKTKAVFAFPKVKDNYGNAFERTYFLEAGTNANPSVIIDTIDIKDYDFNLTGADGSLANYLTANMTMFSNESSASFTITNQDTVLLALSFEGLKAKYAKGYFGQYNISDISTLKFPQLKKISGLLELDSVKMDLNIQNGLDLIAQTKLISLEGKNTLTGQSTPLDFPLINQFLNINPATGGLYNFQPSDYIISINTANSNIEPFITNFPDSMAFEYNIKINPNGNVSGGTDQFFPNSRINLMADAEIPLNIKLNDFSVKDTFKLSSNEIDDQLESGIMFIKYKNTFPLSANLTIYVLDKKSMILDSIAASSILKAGIYDSNSKTTSESTGTIAFNLSNSQIENISLGKNISVSATFNTDQLSFVKLNMSDYIDFSISSDLNIKISLK
ncbi:MAG: hypothetical protein AB8B74_12910 [Crocinitomicaceae bacterium]